MARSTTSKLLVVLGLVALVAVPVLAQGRGWCGGRGAGMGPGCMAGAGGGAAGVPGWTRWAQPQTEQEKKYVDEVVSLHTQIRAKQAQVWQLQNAQASGQEMAKRQGELTALRDKLHKLMDANRELQQKMMAGSSPAASGCPLYGTASCPRTGGGSCPWGGPGAGCGRGQCGMCWR